MKEKTSITLSSEVLAEVDREAASGSSRSAVIETVLREYYKRKTREALNARDAELINAHAEYLNREMEDVLRYQAPIDFDEEA
jgi:metal-responsive CopG/Arc/MetJ family transcriptional regulator